MKTIKPFEKRIWLSSPTMHGKEIEFITDAIDKNWVTTAGETSMMSRTLLRSL